jgi:Holliday junction resolvase
MVHNRYAPKGIAKERYFVRKAKDEGKIALRSAASHSPIDVVIIDPIERKITFMQCKPDGAPQSSKDRIMMDNLNLNGAFQVEFVVR